MIVLMIYYALLVFLRCLSVQRPDLVLCICHNPVFLHAISLTVPSSTEPVGFNPFDDEDDDEETPEQQPNSSPANVKKEEVVAKMLVNGTHLFCSRSSYGCLVCLLFALFFLQFFLSDGCFFLHGCTV